MRLATRVLIVLLALLIAATISHCQQTSEVVVPKASVFSQTSSKSRVVRTLEQGQRVLIDMTVSNSEAIWCLVRQPEGNQRSGYVPCEQLSDEALPKVVPSVPVFDPATTASAPTGVDAKRGVENRDPLVLTEAQLSEIARLKAEYNIEALRDDAVKAYRRFGVTDDFSGLNRTVQAGKRPYGDSFFFVMEPKIRRGAVQYKAFWNAYWNLLTQEQKNAIAKRNPVFLLAYLSIQSDPESAFNAYVLAELRRTSRK